MMKFCPYCGKNVDGKPCDCEGYLAAQAEETVKSEKVKKEVKIPKVQLDKKKIIAIAIVVCVVIGGLLGYSNYANTLNLGDYIEVYDTYGFDGSGSVSYSVDTEALTLDYFGDEYESLNNGSYSEADWVQAMAKFETMYNEIDNIILCIVDATEGNEALSNGDTITIAFEFENTNKYKFSKRIKGGEMTYTVDGLKDAFNEEAVSVTFKGVNGEGSVKIDVVNEEPYYNYIYRAEPEEGLSNGDTITLSIEPGYYAEPLSGDTQKDFIVSGLGDYLTINDTVSQEEIDELYNFAKEQVIKYQNNYWGFEPYGEPTVDKIYLIGASDGSVQKGYMNNSFLEYRNMIVMLTTFGVKNTNGTNAIAEMQYVIAIPDCVINQDGNVTCDYDNFIYKRFDEGSTDVVVQQLMTDYPALTYIELPIA